ncbi:MAG: hypothetical protein AB7I27_12310 [Bacteriovoracaceae bacterium]
MKIWFLILVILVSVQFVKAAQLNVVRGEYDSGKLYVPCTFDNFSDTCFIDTGATFSSVANMEQFGVYPIAGKIRFMSASGTPKDADEITIKTLSIDNFVINFIKVARLDPEDGFENLVGINTISARPFSFLFDPVSTLNLGIAMPLNSQIGVEQYENGIFSIPVQVGGTQTRGLWDTGAGLTSIDINYIISNPDEFIFVQDISNGVDGTGKPVVMKLYKVKNLVIDKHVFLNEYVLGISFDVIREHVDKNISVIIGFNLITKANWYFDLQEKLWAIE